MIKVIKLFSICIFFSLLSCKEEGVVYNKFFEITNSTWEHQDTLEFNFNIEDTSKYYEVILQLRNDESYKWQNIWLFYSLSHDTNKKFIYEDRKEFDLIEEGHWRGKKSGNIIESNFINFINKKVKFPSNGDYTLRIQQGMRDTSLIGCLDVGLKIKEINN